MRRIGSLRLVPIMMLLVTLALSPLGAAALGLSPSGPITYETYLPIVLRSWRQYIPHEWWEIEVVDTNGDIPSIDLDQDQQPHIAYACSGRAGSVCYSVRSGTEWLAVEAVGAFWGEVDLALDDADHPHISSGNGELAYSYHDGSSWTVQVVEPYVGDGLGRNSALALDENGHVHIVYYGPQSRSEATNLWHAVYDGNQWVKETIASDAWGNGRGVSSGLLAGPGTELHGIYQSGASWANSVSYARFDGDTWSTQRIASGEAGAIAMAPDGSLHASFVSATKVRHATLVGSQWVIQDVANFGTPYASVSPLGFVLEGATSIQVDRRNRPHIAFYNHLTRESGQLCYARWDGSQWQLQVVDTEGRPGFGRLSLVLDPSDKAHIAYYDLVSSQVRYARMK